MPMKILASIKKYLISVIIQVRQNTMIIQTSYSSAKVTDQSAGVSIKERVVFILGRQQ